jgi:Family of unknown function (DUF5994)
VSTSEGPAHPDRVPLRLRVALPPVPRDLHGGWWPQSRDLALEMADLADHLPPELGRVSRAWVVPGDWDAPPTRVQVADGGVKVGALPRGDRDVIELRTSGRRRLRLLVVPAAMSTGQGEEALLAAATPGNAYSASTILQVVGEFDDVDPFDHWVDTGDTWWGANEVAPSFRSDG